MDVKQAGKKGGLTTKRKHGADHYRRIGRAGGNALWKKLRVKFHAEKTIKVPVRVKTRKDEQIVAESGVDIK